MWRVESRVRLELECLSQCLLVQLEEERTGLVLSLDCQYDDDGAPTDLLTAECQHWFAKAGWDSVKTVGDVMTNMKEEQGIRHCIQVGGRRAGLTGIISTDCISLPGGYRQGEPAGCQSQGVD